MPLGMMNKWYGEAIGDEVAAFMEMDKEEDGGVPPDQSKTRHQETSHEGCHSDFGGKGGGEGIIVLDDTYQTLLHLWNHWAYKQVM